MLHTISDTERRYGFLKADEFSNYAANHVFRGVYAKQLDGTIKQRLRHKKGDFHRHSYANSRVDGFTELISGIGDFVDIVVSDNIIYITEI